MLFLLAVGLHLSSDEPEATIGPVIKAFQLGSAKARIAVQGPLRGHGEIAAIWRNLGKKAHGWHDLKRKLHRLRQLNAALPAFTLRYAAVSIDFLPKDNTIELRSENYDALRKLAQLYEKEPRHPAYGAGVITSITALEPMLPTKRAKAGRQKSPQGVQNEYLNNTTKE